jgi:hypothetical protein
VDPHYLTVKASRLFTPHHGGKLNLKDVGLKIVDARIVLASDQALPDAYHSALPILGKVILDHGVTGDEVAR